MPPQPDIPAGLGNDDPRLRSIIPPQLRPKRLRRVVPVAEIADRLPDDATQAIARVVAEVDGMRLETALVDLVRAADEEFHSPGRRKPCGSRWLEGMSLRIGLMGAPPMTLEEVGRRLSVSRERVRQVMSKHAFLPGCQRPYLPQLDRALALLDQWVPCSLGDLSARLNAAGLAGPRMSYDSLRAAALFTGRRFDFGVHAGFVARDQEEARMVLSAARRLGSRHGVFQTWFVTEEVATEGWKLTEAEAERYLVASPDVRHLTEDYYFHSGAARNRLVNSLKSILAVHQPLPLETVTAATRRLYEWRNYSGGSGGREVIPPPAHVLRAFCLRHEEFEVHDEPGRCLVRATEPLDWRKVLGTESRVMVSVLHDAPHHTLDRQTFIDRCAARGVKPNTAAVHLSYHPAFVRLGRNVWTLLGVDVPSDVVERLQHRWSG